jgi:hypothetical protein
MHAGAEKLGVIEASYASAIIGVLSPVSSHCCFSGSIRPWLVMSHNMPMINTNDTASKLAWFNHRSQQSLGSPFTGTLASAVCPDSQTTILMNS